MTQQRHHVSTLNTLQRFVARLAVLSILLAAGLDGMHHMAHAGHLDISPTPHANVSDHNKQGLDHVSMGQEHRTQSTASETRGHGCDPAHRKSTKSPVPSDPSSDHHDCAQCCAAHCLACVMPTPVTIALPWLISKKIATSSLFAAPPPTWRLERPPKTIL